MDDTTRALLESVKAAGQVVLPELPQLEHADAETRAAFTALHRWAEQLRTQLSSAPQVYASGLTNETERENELNNRLLALEERLNRGLRIEDGPADPEHVLLDETLAETGGCAVGDGVPQTDAETGTAGTSTTALRDDTKPGLKLVGNPGDVTEDAATGNFVPTMEFVKDNATPVVRRGSRVRLGAVDYGYLAASYAHLMALAAGANVTKTGLMVPLVTTGCLKGTVNGLDVNIGDGLEIDANVLKAVWVADP